MKFSTVIASLIVFASMNVSAEINKEEFIKKKTFGKFSFIGCMIEIDQPASYVYLHIGNTYVKTQSDNVTIQIDKEMFSQGLSNKKEFVNEYIYRQNYCSFIR